MANMDTTAASYHHHFIHSNLRTLHKLIVKVRHLLPLTIHTFVAEPSSEEPTVVSKEGYYHGSWLALLKCCFF